MKNNTQLAKASLILLSTCLVLLPGCHQEAPKFENNVVYEETPTEPPRAKLDTLLDGWGTSYYMLTVDGVEYIVVVGTESRAIIRHLKNEPTSPTNK